MSNKLILESLAKLLPAASRIIQPNTDRQTHTKEIISLHRKICVDRPIRIDTTKIKQPIQLRNLSWILAFCRMSYNSLGDVDFDDTTLKQMADDIRESILETLQYSERLEGLNAKVYSEGCIVLGEQIKDYLSFNLPPELVVEFISNDPVFCNYIFSPTLGVTPAYLSTGCHECNSSGTVINFNHQSFTTNITNQTENEIHVTINEPAASQSAPETFTPKYREDTISDAVINNILPKVLPKKIFNLSEKRNVNLLAFKCFCELEDALKSKGYEVTFVQESNKEKSEITFSNPENELNFKDDDGKPLTHKAFKVSFPKILGRYLTS